MKVAVCVESYWEEKIQSAKSSIVIISPYITKCRATQALIDKARQKGCECRLVTHGDVKDHIIANSQLELMNEAMSASVCISMVDKLHAKALIVDNQLVSIGSQNFTRNGELNKELTVELNMEWSAKNEGLAELYTAVNQAKELELSLLKKWFEIAQDSQLEVDTFNKKLDDLIKTKLDPDIDDSPDPIADKKPNSVGWAVKTGTETISKNTIIMTYTRDGESYKFKRKDEGHLRYVEYEDINLCELSIKQDNGHTKDIRLSKASLVPMQVNDSGRYVLCKLNHTTFSQFIDELVWQGRLPIFNQSVTVTLTCFKTRTQQKTFKLMVKDQVGNSFTVNILAGKKKLAWLADSLKEKHTTTDFAEVMKKIRKNSQHWLAEVFNELLYKPVTNYTDKNYIEIDAIFDPDFVHYRLETNLLGKGVGFSLLPYLV